MKRYVGITIGPIFDALNLAKSPAGLWAASFLFSRLSRDLCEVLGEKVGDDTKIVSPYFDKGDTGLNLSDGVGLFHDRIIVQTDLSLDEVNKIIHKVKVGLSELLFTNAEASDRAKYLAFFDTFFRVRAITFETDGNPIVASSKELDAIELEAQFRSEEDRNYLAELFENTNSEKKNETVKALVRKTFDIGDAWQLLGNAELFEGDEKSETSKQAARKRKWKQKAVRDLSDIAATHRPSGDKHKRYKYYAIIQSDGDGIGKILVKMSFTNIEDGLETLREKFSYELLEYSREASQIVKGYGGVTLYAGGDDLLAIVPVSGEGSKTILDLVSDLREAFSTKILEPPGSPTLSFGVAICYKKYPLGEALVQARNLLFGKAKQSTGKDALAISLLKHSGQNASFLLKTLTSGLVADKLIELIGADEDDKYFAAIGQHLRDFEPLFREALTDARGPDDLKNVFTNVFDSGFHADQEGPLTAVRELLWLARDQADNLSKPRKEGEEVPAIDALLRFVRFFSETGDDE